MDQPLEIQTLELQREELLIESERCKLAAEKLKVQILELRIQQRADRAQTVSTYLDSES